MKFAVVVVLVALALGANSSVIPIGWPGSVVVGHHHAGISVDHGHGPVVVGGPGSVAIQAAVHGVPHVVGVHGVHDIHGVHGIHGIHGVHGLSHVHGLAHVGSPVQIVAGPHVHPAVVPAVVPGGVAVSQTRGAVHVAPLAGHAQSVVQSNLQPAPGTI